MDDVAAIAEDRAGQAAHGHFICDQQQGLGSPARRRVFDWRCLGCRGVIDSWEIDFESGPVIGFAINADVPTALLDDAVTRRQPQTGAFARPFGCEEWLK